MQWIKKGKEWKRQVEIRNTERVQRNGRKIEGGGKKAIGSGTGIQMTESRTREIGR